MFGTFLATLAAAAVATGPPVPAADSPVREHDGTVVFSSYDLARDVYRLTVERGGRAQRLAVAPSEGPFDADVGPGADGSPVVAYSRGGDVFEVGFDGSPERPRGAGRRPTIWNGRIAAVRGGDVVIDERAVASAHGVTELELRGDDLAIATRTRVRIVGAHERSVAVGGDTLGLSFAEGHVGWYDRGAHRMTLVTGERETSPGPGDVSGFALLPGGRTLRVEPEGEDGRLRRTAARPWRGR